MGSSAVKVDNGVRMAIAVHIVPGVRVQRPRKPLLSQFSSSSPEGKRGRAARKARAVFRIVQARCVDSKGHYQRVERGGREESPRRGFGRTRGAGGRPDTRGSTSRWRVTTAGIARRRAFLRPRFSLLIWLPLAPPELGERWGCGSTADTDTYEIRHPERMHERQTA